jgi:hypothetical protein
MNRPPASVSAALMLIILDAAFWLVFAILVALEAMGSTPATGAMKWVMVILALISSVALAGIAILLRKRVRFAFYFGLTLLALIAVLSITDQVGLLDLFTLLLNLGAFGLMVKDRTWYLRSGNSAPAADQAPVAGDAVTHD